MGVDADNKSLELWIPHFLVSVHLQRLGMGMRSLRNDS